MKNTEEIRSILLKNKIGKKIISYLLKETNKLPENSIYKGLFDKVLDKLTPYIKEDQEFKEHLYNTLIEGYFPSYIFENENKELIKDLVIKHLQLTLKTGFSKLLVPKKFKIIEEFLKDGNTTKLKPLSNELSSLVNIQSYYTYSISALIISYITSGANFKDPFFLNMIKLSFYISPVRTFELFIAGKCAPLNECEIDALFNKQEKAKAILKTYGLPLYLYLQFVIFRVKSLPWLQERSGINVDQYESINLEKENVFKEIEEYATSNIDDLIMALTLVDHVAITVIKRVYGHNKQKFNMMFVNDAENITTSSKMEFATELLSQNLEDLSILEPLLESKKAPSKELAVSVFINTKYGAIKSKINTLAKTEKNKKVKALMGDYLAMI